MTEGKKKVGGYINPYKLFIGSFVPNWLLRRTEINSTDKLVYAKLCQYAGKDGKCYPSQERLSEDLGFSRQHISIAIKNLIREKLIITTRTGLGKNNEYKFLMHEWVTSRCKPYLHPDVNNTLQPDVNNTLHPIYKRIIKENNIKEGGKAVLEKKEVPVKNKGFKKPSIEEVKEYCIARKNYIDPESFIAFYESNGWKVGHARNPMKSWQSAIITWEKGIGTVIIIVLEVEVLFYDRSDKNALS